MSKPRQMFETELNAVKGWPSPYAVDKHADAHLEEGEVIYGGDVMSLNADGKFRLGLAAGAMAIFALQNSFDFDVVGDEGNLVGGGDSTPRMSGLVAVGAYELETTQFVAESSYAPNTPLTSAAPGEADAGKLDVGELYVNDICGVCSNGLVPNDRYLNKAGKNVLRFWPVWLPAMTAED